MRNDQVPASCRKCFAEEEKGIVSKRQWETKVWEKRLDIDSIVEQTDADGNLPVNIPYFDLRLGNLCQLKCVMCSPHDSSSWIKEWKLQKPKYKNKDLIAEQSWDQDFDYTWYKKGSFLDSMKDQAQHIKELYFAGGEPLLIPEHYAILEFMVDNGFSKHICIRYNSNGLELPDKLFALWKHFEEVTFNFSIDAYGDKNDYIRYPSKWKDISTNLHKLDKAGPNIKVNMACAVQLLNVAYIHELAEWKIQQQFNNINVLPFGGGLIGTHLVYFPSYLNIRVLPQAYKQFAKDNIERFIDSQKFNSAWNEHAMGKRRFEGLIEYMMSEDWSNKLPQLQDYLRVLDEQRGTDFRKTFPELGEHI